MDYIMERLQQIQIWQAVIVLILAVLGYGTRPIVKRLGFIPEEKKDTAVLWIKGGATVMAVLVFLVVAGFIHF